MSNESNPERATGESSARQGSSCWLTDDYELHPIRDCPESDHWLPVATNGHERWINCPQCNITMYLPTKEQACTAP